MSITIPALTRRAVPALLASGLALSPAGPAAVSASATTTVPLRAVNRACDFSPILSGASQSNATATAVVRADYGTEAADVHISEPGTPGAHFDVALIQMPHPPTLSCTEPGPGVAVNSVELDGAGQGSTTVQGLRLHGATGVWVFIQRRSPHSQGPAEFYTSDFIAPV